MKKPALILFLILAIPWMAWAQEVSGNFYASDAVELNPAGIGHFRHQLDEVFSGHRSCSYPMQFLLRGSFANLGTGNPVNNQLFSIRRKFKMGRWQCGGGIRYNRFDAQSFGHHKVSLGFSLSPRISRRFHLEGGGSISLSKMRMRGDSLGIFPETVAFFPGEEAFRGIESFDLGTQLRRGEFNAGISFRQFLLPSELPLSPKNRFLAYIKWKRRSPRAGYSRPGVLDLMVLYRQQNDAKNQYAAFSGNPYAAFRSLSTEAGLLWGIQENKGIVLTHQNYLNGISTVGTRLLWGFVTFGFELEGSYNLRFRSFDMHLGLRIYTRRCRRIYHPPPTFDF